MGDWLFGCDLCQTVCPWNERLFKGQLEIDQTRPLTSRAALVEELRMILTSSNKSLERQFNSTPLSRARPKGLKRNAIIVAANQGLTELIPEMEDLAEHDQFTALARWALDQLSTL
jgi:epoxyqueuosine reductase